MSIYRCFYLNRVFQKVAKFQNVKNKAPSKRLSIMSSPTLKPIGASDVQKYDKIPNKA